MSLKEVEQDPFDADEFVERLAWRARSSISKDGDDFDPLLLHTAFEQTIRSLQDMNVKIQKQVEDLEEECIEEEKCHWQRVAELQKHNQTAFKHFQSLDERINFVATKVVHLGDQLEGVNTPRTRLSEAHMLMKYFDEFASDKPLKSDIFTDPFQVQIAAEVIQKLYMIAQELPKDKFAIAQKRITDEYNRIEQDLIMDFKNAYHEGDKRRLKRLASILHQFKGYSQCIDVFVEQSQKGSMKKLSPFEEIPLIIERTNTLIIEVFINPEMVLSKLVLNIYNEMLKEHIYGELMKTENQPEKYLQTLFTLYKSTNKLSSQLSGYKMGNESNFLNKLVQTIFRGYLQSYIKKETQYLQNKCESMLSRFYESKNHRKKDIQSGIHKLGRDLETVIGTKANINLGLASDNYGEETFLSQEVAINLLQESKLALQRCHVLSSSSELPSNACLIFDLLINYLCVEHLDYAIELGLQAIPLADPKTKPQIFFFDIVGNVNQIFHLFEKQFSDNLVPLISASPKHSECLQKKRDTMEYMEGKLDIGVDRTLTAIMGWVKHILSTEQKKSDFKPEDIGSSLPMFSQACAQVMNYLHEEIDTINFSLDGKNVDAVHMELGIRFHRVVYEHFNNFQYNTLGGALAICDVNEYKKLVEDFNIPAVTKMFQTLHSLCNLLLVMPDNLKIACTEDELAELDKTVLHSFVQLRADYRTEKLALHFR